MKKILDIFTRCGDLLECKSIVERLEEPLLSDEADAYLEAVLREYSHDSQLVQTMTWKRDLLRACRAEGINRAFINLFLTMYPDPVSDTVATQIVQASSPEALTELVGLHPEWLGEIQRVIVATQLIEDLKQEAQSVPPDVENIVRSLMLCDAGLRLVDRRIDPYTWAEFQGEFANALMRGPVDPTANGEAFARQCDEAIARYYQVLAFYEQAGLPELESNTLQNLGMALANRAQGEANRDVRDGLAFLKRALHLRQRERVPLQWAQTQYAIGHAYMQWQGDERPDQIEHAISHFEQGLEVSGPEHTHALWAHLVVDLAQAYLERTSGVRTENLRQAIHWYQAYIARGHTSMAREELMSSQARLEHAYSLLGRTLPAPEADAEEMLTPVFDDQVWVLAQRQQQSGVVLDEWVPAGTSLSDWTSMVTTWTQRGAEAMPFAGFLEAKHRFIMARTMNGAFAWDIVEEQEDEVVYTWGLQDDFGVEDQYECVRVVRGSAALHAIHYAARGPIDETIRLSWLNRLKEARIVEGKRPPVDPSAAEITEPQQDEVDRLIGRLKEDPPADAAIEARTFYRETLGHIPRSTNPELWASISNLIGLYLCRVPQFNREVVDTAILAIKRSMEVFAWSTHPEAWTLSLKSLALTYKRRGAGEERKQYLEQARFGFEKVVHAYSTIGHVENLGEALHQLAIVTFNLGYPSDQQRMLEGVDLFKQALHTRPFEAEPRLWADTMLALGDAYLSLSETEMVEDFRGMAETTYEQLLNQLTVAENAKSIDTYAYTELYVNVYERLVNTLDRKGISKPSMPVGYKERSYRGTALYLRPLSSADTLWFPNKLRIENMSVKFEVEPEMITLESVLYRTLGEHLNCMTLGGRPEGLGMTRFFVQGGDGWQETVRSLFTTCDLVFMVPSDSEGVRWEVGFLLEQGALGRVLFIMPPASSRYDVRALWEDAHGMMRDYDLTLPPYEEKGLVIRYHGDGSLADVLSFDHIWNNTLYENIEPLLSDLN